MFNNILFVFITYRIEATPNPDEFCANKQSPYDTLYAGDRDGEGWEEDTYMLNMT